MDEATITFIVLGILGFLMSQLSNKVDVSIFEMTIPEIVYHVVWGCICSVFTLSYIDIKERAFYAEVGTVGCELLFGLIGERLNTYMKHADLRKLGRTSAQVFILYTCKTVAEVSSVILIYRYWRSSELYFMYELSSLTLGWIVVVCHIIMPKNPRQHVEYIGQKLLLTLHISSFISLLVSIYIHIQSANRAQYMLIIIHALFSSRQVHQLWRKRVLNAQALKNIRRPTSWTDGVNFEQTECPICKDDSVENIVELRCKHVYHEECLTRWLAKNPTCPACNKKVI